MRIEVGLCTVGRESLVHAIRALALQTRPCDRLIVVNQGPDDVRAIVESQYKGNLTFIQQDARGLSRARNAVLEAFGGDWLAWADDDEEPAPDWLRQMELVAEAHPQAGFIGGPMLPPLKMEEDEFIEELYAVGDTLLDVSNFLKPIMDVPGLVHDCWGGNMSLRSDLVKAVGVFDQELGAGTRDFPKAEETDYLLRALSQGFIGLLTPRVVIYHTYGARHKNPGQDEEQARCNAVLIWKSSKDPNLILPDLAKRLEPYSRRRLLLAKLTGGAISGGHKETFAKMQAVWTRLDTEFELAGGCLKRRAGE